MNDDKCRAWTMLILGIIMLCLSFGSFGFSCTYTNWEGNETVALLLAGGGLCFIMGNAFMGGGIDLMVNPSKKSIGSESYEEAYKPFVRRFPENPARDVFAKTKQKPIYSIITKSGSKIEVMGILDKW